MSTTQPLLSLKTNSSNANLPKTDVQKIEEAVQQENQLLMSDLSELVTINGQLGFHIANTSYIFSDNNSPTNPNDDRILMPASSSAVNTSSGYVPLERSENQFPLSQNTHQVLNDILNNKRSSLKAVYSSIKTECMSNASPVVINWNKSNLLLLNNEGTLAFDGKNILQKDPLASSDATPSYSPINLPKELNSGKGDSYYPAFLTSAGKTLLLKRLHQGVHNNADKAAVERQGHTSSPF